MSWFHIMYIPMATMELSQTLDYGPMMQAGFQAALGGVTYGALGFAMAAYTGKSFAPKDDILNPDTGNYYCCVDNKTIKDYLQQKRLNSYKLHSSAHFGLSEQIIKDPSTLYINRPRIIFQDITNDI